MKSDSERAMYGGIARCLYDPCYHQACDTMDNINTKVLREMTEAAAQAVIQTVNYDGEFR